MTPPCFRHRHRHGLSSLNATRARTRPPPSLRAAPAPPGQPRRPPLQRPAFSSRTSICHAPRPIRRRCPSSSISIFTARLKFAERVPARRSFCVARGRLSCGNASLNSPLSQLAKHAAMPRQLARHRGKRQQAHQRSQSPSKSRRGRGVAAPTDGRSLSTSKPWRKPGFASTVPPRRWGGWGDGAPGVRRWIRRSAFPSRNPLPLGGGSGPCNICWRRASRGLAPFDGANASKRRTSSSAPSARRARRRSSRPCSAIW